MRKQFIILITLLSAGLITNAQEFRLTKSAGQLKLYVTGVIVEGYDGKEIIFSGQKAVADAPDERANGLVPISSSPFKDNTGMGISVIENGNDVSVNLVSKKPIGVLTVKVPNNIKVSILQNNGQIFFSNYNYNSNKSDEIVLRNLKNEIEVSVTNNKIRLENNTGPMNIKTVSGSVDAIFNSEIKGPVSIISVANYVDVTLPSSTKANIEMGTTSGKLYAGKEFKIELDKVDNTEKPANYRVEGINLDRNTATVVRGYATRAKKETEEVKKVEGEKIKENLALTLTGVGNINQAINSEIFTIGYSSIFRGAGDVIKGKLNGGGIDLIFKSNSKNVYLRQQ